MCPHLCVWVPHPERNTNTTATSLSYIPTCTFVGIYVGKVNTAPTSSLPLGLSGISSKDPILSLGYSAWNLPVGVVLPALFSGLCHFEWKEKQNTKPQLCREQYQEVCSRMKHPNNLDRREVIGETPLNSPWLLPDKFLLRFLLLAALLTPLCIPHLRPRIDWWKKHPETSSYWLESRLGGPKLPITKGLIPNLYPHHPGLTHCHLPRQLPFCLLTDPHPLLSPHQVSSQPPERPLLHQLTAPLQTFSHPPLHLESNLNPGYVPTSWPVVCASTSTSLSSSETLCPCPLCAGPSSLHSLPWTSHGLPDMGPRGQLSCSTNTFFPQIVS